MMTLEYVYFRMVMVVFFLSLYLIC